MAIRSRSGKEGRTDEPDPEPRAGRHPTPRVHEQENGNDHAIGAPTAVDQASARRPARNRDPVANGVHGPMDERGDRVQGTIETIPAAQAGRFPGRQDIGRL